MAFNLFMHERNIYKERPDFKKIAIEYPEFRIFAVPDEKGRIHMDFNNQDALRMLTKILLKKDFNLNVTIPDGFLIPTVPQRLNYLLWVEDLLSMLPNRSNSMSGIDIGTGPCAIFSLLGAKKNGWNFVATETSDEAIDWAEKNIKANNLESVIKIQKVSNGSIFNEVLPANEEVYDFCLCNPPFFENIDEIKRRSTRATETLATLAKKDEILAEGGEVTFVKNMIRDSLLYKNRVRLYTSMFGRKKSFIQVLKELQNTKDISYTKTEFCQGNTIRWGIAWTFLDSINLQKVEQPKPKKKPKKVKPPLLHTIPSSDKRFPKVKKLAKWLKNSFLELEIHFKVNKCAENYAEIQITTNKNTWSHQRRKKRECLKDKHSPKNIKTTVSETQSISDIAGSSHSEMFITSPLDTNSCKESKSLEVVSTLASSEVVTEMQENDSTVNSVVFTNPNSSQVVISSQKRKIDDEERPEIGPPLQKLKTENIEDSERDLQLQIESKKIKKVDEDSLKSSKSWKIKVEDSRISQEFQTKYSEEHPNGNSVNIKEETAVLSDETTSNQSKVVSSEYIIEKDFVDEQKTNVIFDPKSLLFCVLKIRKGEDHLLLEMNCPPESNRESMHQIFQFLKNKLDVS